MHSQYYINAGMLPMIDGSCVLFTQHVLLMWMSYSIRQANWILTGRRQRHNTLLRTLYWLGCGHCPFTLLSMLVQRNTVGLYLTLRYM